MPEPPEIRITRGAPTPEEEEAVRAAVLRLWREDQARAARDRPEDGWVAAARAEATGRGVGIWRRGPKAWRLSARFTGPESHITIGRGDAK